MASDLANALVAIDQIRKADPNYRTGQVDGMYYFVLRNYGFDLIVKSGNLGGGSRIVAMSFCEPRSW